MTTSTVAGTLSDADKAAIAAIPARVVAAWAAHDAQAFAEVFAADGTMVLPGLYKKGREEIQSFMAAAFTGPYRGTRVTGQPIDVRCLGPDTALVITEGGVVGADEAALTTTSTIHATWVAAKRDGVWQLAAYHNSPKDL